MSVGYKINYKFQYPNGGEKSYPLVLDAETLSLQSGNLPRPAFWTKLEFGQCSHCPLQKEKLCPIAANISGIVETFKDEISYQKVLVTVETPERTFSKEVSLQVGLYSMLGIIMATSGCPVMDFFKPMARFHLPFSTTEETIVRSASIYLLRQYFAKKRGQVPDFDLIELEKIYSQVSLVNKGIIARIRKANEVSEEKGDADQNAITILTNFGQMLSLEINEKLSSIDYLFPSDD